MREREGRGSGRDARRKQSSGGVWKWHPYVWCWWWWVYGCRKTKRIGDTMDITGFFTSFSSFWLKKGIVCTLGQYKMAVGAPGHVTFNRLPSRLFFFPFPCILPGHLSNGVTLRRWCLWPVLEPCCIFSVWTSSAFPTSAYLMLYRRDSSVGLNPDLCPHPGKLSFMKNQTLCYIQVSFIKVSNSTITFIISFCSPTPPLPPWSQLGYVMV